MRITFLMPCYMWGPSGGFRVVYEYANHLVARGHQVTVVHPRRPKFTPKERLTLRGRFRKARLWVMERCSTPTIDWHSIDARVRLLYVPSSEERYIPDADAIFATAWHTACPVLSYSSAKGEKCYLIQHYETWMGPQERVDQTWRSPLHKVVVSKWLLQLGRRLGASDLTYIPNAIDLQKYQIVRPIESRPRRVAMMFSAVPFKGAEDGIRALELARQQFPDLQVSFFGVGRRQPWIPEWIRYFQNPAQGFIVDQIYNASSIFMSSSWTEGFGLPPGEAAACGCAIVATDSGGIREYAEHGVTGLLSTPKDPDALAANLCLLLGNEALRIRLAHAAHRLIARFTWERSARLFEEFLLRAVERCSPSEDFIPANFKALDSLHREGGATSATRES